jgi:hypothetical protein
LKDTIRSNFDEGSMTQAENKRSYGTPLCILAFLCIVCGCSSSKRVYLPDGRGAYVTSCESKGWQRCYLRATKKCKPGKYEVLERHYEHKALYYQCEPAAP